MKSPLLFAATLALATAAHAQMPAPPATLSFQPTSKLWIAGTSTVRDFKCQAGALNSTPVTTQARVSVVVAQLDCGNGKMNEHMRNALKADANPIIEFDMTSYTMDGANATLKGTLRMAGSSKEIEIPATVQKEGEGLRVTASKQINMTQWGVKPPSLMLGAMKVKDAVTVAFDVTLKP